MDPLRGRHASAGVLHSDEVLVLLLRPRQKGRTGRPLHPLEARVPVNVHGDVPECRVRNAVDLHRLRATVGAGRVEHVRFLPGAHRIVQGREDPVRDQVGDRQEGRVVEDLVVRLARLRILLLRQEGIDLGLQDAETALINHAEKRTFRSTMSFVGRQKMLIDFGIRPRRLM